MRNKPNARNSRLAPELRKAEIIAIARDLLGKVGHENFLPLDVAQLYGVAEGTIYRYFPTKKDLLQAVAEDWVEELLTTEIEESKDSDLESRLHHSIESVLHIVFKEPSLTRYIFLNQRADPNYSNTRLYKLVRHFTTTIINIVEEAVSQGIFRSDVPILLVRDMIFGAIEHQTWAYLRSEGKFSIKDSSNFIAGIIFRGMSTATPPNQELIEQSETRLKAATEQLNQELSTLLQRVR